MEEVRQLVQEEGREARNLIAFHVAVDTPGRVRKPPLSAPALPRPARRAPARLRSASAGRDKRSELRARYWALLFGDLQRAVGEIYNTVEVHENPNECQEVILVLENYTRDFKALCEWFRLKWEYESTPPPQRPQSLAWEIRKTDFVRPESRLTHSVKSSPSVSGKNSPCFSGHNTPSGKNSPNLTGKASPGSGKISPRMTGHVTSPKGSVEFFSSKITSKIATKPEPKVGKETRLSDIKEKDVKDVEEDKKADAIAPKKDLPGNIVEIGEAKECPNVTPKQVVVKSPKRSDDKKAMANGEFTSQALATINQLDNMESEFLAKQLTENVVKNDNLLNLDSEHAKTTYQKNQALKVLQNKEKINSEVTNNITISIESVDQLSVSTESPSTKSEDDFADVSNESSKCDDKVKEMIINEAKTKPESNSDANENDNAKQITNNNEIPKYDKSMSQITNECNVKTEHLKHALKIKDTTKSEIKEKVKYKHENETETKTHSKKDDVKKKLADLKKDDIKVTERPQFEHKEFELKTRPIFELKPWSRPAYSQAAAKPKLVTPKMEVKTPTKTVAISKTVVEIRTQPSKSRSYINQNQKSKCSYPFNLTTGRTSLFDAGNKPTNTAKKPPTNKQTQLASGDNRNLKTETKNRPARPMTLKINDKSDKTEKNISNIEKIKDLDEYSSSETVVTQIDMSRIESSESLRTIVPDIDQDIANSIEVLNVDGNKHDNEGWLTVKSRRFGRESKKSKSHWSNRFNHPSATTSLPTLNMIESPKSETNPTITFQLDRAKSEQPQTINQMKLQKPENKNHNDHKESTAKVPTERNVTVKEMSMIRQKSDVTGLKSRSSRTKALKKDKKQKDCEEKLTKNRLHSSLESLTIGLQRSQESTVEAFDFDKWRSDFESTFIYLEDDDRQDNTEILMTADPSEMSEIAEMTSQIEENERKISLALDFQTEVDQRKLCEEEDLLNRQIMELQQVSDIDLDTETDETETDAEILCEESTLESCLCSESLGSLCARLEDQYETALAGMSWAERVDTLGALEALVARDPGRAQQLHAKLSQGMKRRGSLQDALRRLQAKQARAERQRTHFHTERAKRIHQLLARVEEVKVAKTQLIDEKRIRMERRLQKAAENRDQHLKDIVRKAHDEEEKLREIAFITQLEAENRRHEFLEQCRSHTTRLRAMRRERLDKLEQKSAREAAVGARKKALEAARKQHVESLLEKRKERDARVEGLKEQKKQERDDAAREKAEGVKSRLSALAAAAELEADALRSRIRDKQDASQQRLECHLQAIREKAVIGPRQATISECQEKTEEEAKAELEREKRERERVKSVRKRARKLRQKLLVDTKDHIIDNTEPHQFMNSRAAKLHKLVSHIHGLIKPFVTDETDGKTDDVKLQITKITNNNEEEKPKKKKKKSRDRQLSACDSVCSSLSDRSSKANDQHRQTLTLDVAGVDRALNEVHRMCSSHDTKEIVLLEEKTSSTRVHTIRTLGRVMSLAVERDDVSTRLTTRVLNTCICIIYKMSFFCPIAARTWLAHPGVVHSVMLLQQQMEKDMLNDPKEDELTKNLAEAVYVALNTALPDVHRYQDGRLAPIRARAHNLISFLCLSGVVSYPERCKDSRKNIQTLLNVCGDVLLPMEDDGPERSVAQQSLRSVLGPDIFNMRNDFCMLFAEGAEIAQNDVFVNAARIAHVLRALAEIDHRIVQEAFGEGGWPLEFRAAIARLLSQHAPSDKEAPRTEPLRPGVIRLDAKVSLTFVLDLIQLTGYVTVNNPSLRDTICDNWSVIKMLCNLPANWMVSPPHMHQLLPTLLVLAERPATAEVIASEINLQRYDSQFLSLMRIPGEVRFHLRPYLIMELWNQILHDYMNSAIAQKVRIIQLLKLEQKAGAKKTNK